MKSKILFIILVALSVVSCKKSGKLPETEETILRPSSMVYSSQDSVAIRALVDKYVDRLKANDLNAAADLLYTVRNDSVFLLDGDKRNGFINGMNTFHVYDCKIKSFLLRSEFNNEVKLTLQVISTGDIEQEVGCTHVSLNPVYLYGNWYLTLLDKRAEGVEDVYVTE